MIKKYWDHYFNPNTARGSFEKAFRGMLTGMGFGYVALMFITLINLGR